MAITNYYRLIHAEDPSSRLNLNEEGYLIHPDGKTTALLAEDLPFRPEDGTAVLLVYNAQVNGVAGAAKVPLGQDLLLGGWCSFGCKLAIPRKFAARSGSELIGGANGQQLLVQCVRGALREVFEAAGQTESAEAHQLQHHLNKMLQPMVKQRLFSIGWQLTHCQLENVLMTRSV